MRVENTLSLGWARMRTIGLVLMWIVVMAMVIVVFWREDRKRKSRHAREEDDMRFGGRSVIWSREAMTG